MDCTIRGPHGLSMWPISITVHVMYQSPLVLLSCLFPLHVFPVLSHAYCSDHCNDEERLQYVLNSDIFITTKIIVLCSWGLKTQSVLPNNALPVKRVYEDRTEVLLWPWGTTIARHTLKHLYINITVALLHGTELWVSRLAFLCMFEIGSGSLLCFVLFCFVSKYCHSPPTVDQSTYRQRKISNI